MPLAIKAVNTEEMEWLRSSKMFVVPQATLHRRVTNINRNIQEANKGLGHFRTTLNETLEREVVTHLKLLESCLFGLTCTKVRQLVKSLCSKLRCELSCITNRIHNYFQKYVLLKFLRVCVILP
jgi:hypothetical protein